MKKRCIHQRFKQFLVLSCLLVPFLLSVVLIMSSFGPFVSHAEINSSKVIRVAGDNNFPPFEFEEKRTYQGFNIDILNAVSIETGNYDHFVVCAIAAIKI